MAYVLVVDDDQDFSTAVATVLRSEGHEVALADDPEAALASVAARTPEAVVLDVMFPENPTAGFELARALRRQAPDVPILMLTAVNQEFPLGFSNRDIDTRWLPVRDFLEKPVDFRVLSQKLQALLNAPSKRDS